MIYADANLTNSKKIPESGETMRAAGLKAISVVLNSTAVLIRSKNPSDSKLVDRIASRIRGVISKFSLFSFFLSYPPSTPLIPIPIPIPILSHFPFTIPLFSSLSSSLSLTFILVQKAAQRHVLCTYNVHRTGLDHVRRITPGKRAPTITELEEPGWVAVQAMVERNRIALVMDDLIAAGATDVLVVKIENCRAG